MSEMKAIKRMNKHHGNDAYGSGHAAPIQRMSGMPSYAKGTSSAHPKKWAQAASERMEKKGTEGSLTKAAHAAGFKSPIAYAKHIKANKEEYSGKMRKKANFAVNINK